MNLGIGVNDQVFDVALDPSNPSILWAGIADASGSQPVNVMRSTDSGATWTNRTPPLAAPISCRAIAVDPSDSNTVIAVFAGDFGGGEVWTTTDGGDSWTNRSAGLPNNPMQAVVYDGTRLLVGGGQRFRLAKRGPVPSRRTWARLGHRCMIAPGQCWWSMTSPSILTMRRLSWWRRTAAASIAPLTAVATWQIGIGGTGALAGRSLRFRPGSSPSCFSAPVRWQSFALPTAAIISCSLPTASLSSTCSLLMQIL